MNWTAETLPWILLIGALALIIPILLARFAQDRLLALALVLFVSAMVLMAISGGIFALLDLRAGLDPAAFNNAPGALIAGYLRLGLLAGIVWLPILLITGLGLAQRIERRKGEALAARDKD